jgi:hypothetical protein
MNDELTVEGKRWDTACKAYNTNAAKDRSERVNEELRRHKQTRQEVLAKFTPLIERLLLRFSHTDRFLGQLLVRVPKNIFQTIQCHHPPR